MDFSKFLTMHVNLQLSQKFKLKKSTEKLKNKDMTQQRWITINYIHSSLLLGNTTQFSTGNLASRDKDDISQLPFPRSGLRLNSNLGMYVFNFQEVCLKKGGHTLLLPLLLSFLLNHDNQGHNLGIVEGPWVPKDFI